LKKNLPYIVLVVIVIGAAVFLWYKFLGPGKTKSTQTADNGSQQNGSGFGGQNGQSRGRGGSGQRGNFTPLHGTVSSINGQTIVMKADDGSNKNIICDSNTRISEQDNGQMTQLALTDLKNGDEITVMANGSTSGDITPRMIIIGTFTRPSGGSGRNWGGGDQGSSSDNSGSSDSSSSDSSSI